MTAKLAVVTGAASGIGRATAKRLAQDGNDLCVMDINGEGLRSLTAEIEALGRRAVSFELDFTSREQIEAALGRIANEVGAIPTYDRLSTARGWSCRRCASAVRAASSASTRQ